MAVAPNRQAIEDVLEHVQHLGHTGTVGHGALIVDNHDNLPCPCLLRAKLRGSSSQHVNVLTLASSRGCKKCVAP